MNNKEFLDRSMDFERDEESYTEVVGRLNDNRKLARLLHAAMGISGEAGELMDSVKKAVMYGKPVDTENLKEECGDVLWYMSLLLNAVGSSFEEVMENNYNKLAKRYPNGYSNKSAIERKDKQ